MSKIVAEKWVRRFYNIYNTILSPNNGFHRYSQFFEAVKPVHKLTAEFQFSVVVKTAAMVEDGGGIVCGSITDNHKINQKFCGLFTRKSNHEAVHPLNANRGWYLLFDTVHLLKCLRNNWITEKCKKLSFDGETVGSFADVQELYEAEKIAFLKQHA